MEGNSLPEAVVDVMVLEVEVELVVCVADEVTVVDLVDVVELVGILEVAVVPVEGTVLVVEVVKEVAVETSEVVVVVDAACTRAP